MEKLGTEYAVNVSDWSDEKWEHHGPSVMREYYSNDPGERKRIKDENPDFDVDDIIDELADTHYPMMNYAYPLEDTAPTDEQIREICQTTNCTVVENRETGQYFLALTGGGMDLSQDIALAYLIAWNYIPPSLAYNVSIQPNLSVYGHGWLRVAQGVKNSLETMGGYYISRAKEVGEIIRDFDPDA